MSAVRTWWEKIPDLYKVFFVIASVAAVSLGAGVNLDILTEVPKTTRENRALLLSIDSTLAEHRALPAHAPEARARAAADEEILRAVQRGDSLILETLRWQVCVERLDRREPQAGAARSAELCPPPVPNGREP